MKTRKIILFSIIILFCFPLFSSAQSEESTVDYSHDRYKNEFAIANSPVYFLKEKAFGYGIHLHYIHNIQGTAFGYGLGIEKVFGKYPHNTIGVIAAYRPIEPLALDLAPSLTFEDFHSSPVLALHFEITYDVWEIKNIDIGPAFEIGFESEGIHLSLGLHVCYCF